MPCTSRKLQVTDMIIGASRGFKPGDANLTHLHAVVAALVQRPHWLNSNFLAAVLFVKLLLKHTTCRSALCKLQVSLATCYCAMSDPAACLDPGYF